MKKPVMHIQFFLALGVAFAISATLIACGKDEPQTTSGGGCVDFSGYYYDREKNTAFKLEQSACNALTRTDISGSYTLVADGQCRGDYEASSITIKKDRPGHYTRTCSTYQLQNNGLTQTRYLMEKNGEILETRQLVTTLDSSGNMVTKLFYLDESDRRYAEIREPRIIERIRNTN